MEEAFKRYAKEVHKLSEWSDQSKWKRAREAWLLLDIKEAMKYY